MDLEVWTHKSCHADIGVGENFATVYYIESEEEGKGHATELLIGMQKHYQEQLKEFGYSVALTDRMRFILQKLNITEYI